MTLSSAVILLLAFLCSFSLSIGEPLEKAENETYEQMMLRLAYMIEDNPEYKAEWYRRVKLADELVLPPLRFECEVETSPEVPTSVHKLRPSDIKAVGAFGDSISAGYGIGANTPPEVGIQNRGEVFSVGGDESLERNVITITNFLRKFNPDVKGYSVCDSGRDDYGKAWLNVAVGGSVNVNMPPQARYYVNVLRSDERIDYENDWKIVSLFVGGNDLCNSCNNPIFSPENYGANFRDAVDILHDNVPRLLVQLIVMFDVTPLTNLSTGELCDSLQSSFCGCAVDEETKPQLRQTQLQYYEQLKAIADDEKYQDRDDFAVVLQPHMRDMLPPIDPETGMYMIGFLAPDCFHPNRISHQMFAWSLWNTMLTPVGKKPLTFDTNPGSVDELIAMCPTAEHPYIFTNLNSDVEWP